MKILTLMPDAYCGFGGIAQYNRDLFDVLAGSEFVERIISLARHYPDSDPGLATPPAKLEQHFLAGNSFRYLVAAIKHGLRLRPDLIICGHINLIPVAALLKMLTGASLVLEAYGVEAWQRLPGVRSWGIYKI